MQSTNTNKTNKKPYKSYYRKKSNKAKNESPDDLLDKFDDIVVVTKKTNLNNPENNDVSKFEHKSIPSNLIQKVHASKSKVPLDKSTAHRKQSHSKDFKSASNISPNTQVDTAPKKVNGHSHKKRNSVSSHQKHKSHVSSTESKANDLKTPPVTLNTDNARTHPQSKGTSYKKSFGHDDKEPSKPFKHKANSKSFNGDPKSCPYLNRMKGSKEEIHTETIEFEDDVEVAFEESVNTTETQNDSSNVVLKNHLENDGEDLLKSILNESLTVTDSLLWKSTTMIDINNINCDFEAPELTTNTSTVLMSNAEKEILNKRAIQKHPDDNGGPYVLKLNNLQKGFNSEEIVKEVLKPKGILYVKTKFFWEPNFKVTFDDMKKMCFLEVKYFEEIERCIQLLKRNNYLIKAEHCKHDDFVRISKLQNLQWGDPEFVNKADQLNYKIIKYRVNLAGEPIGVLKDGEEQTFASDKLPSLPTLGSKSIRKDESIVSYSEMAEKIVKSKQKSKEQEEASKSSSPSTVNSPSMTSAFIPTTQAVPGNTSPPISNKNSVSKPSSSTASMNSYKGTQENDAKNLGKKPYKKFGSKPYHAGQTYNNHHNGYRAKNGHSTPRTHSDNGSNGSATSFGFGFAASFGKNAVP